MLRTELFTHIDVCTYDLHRSNHVPHTLLDVREPEEFTLGHIPGALNIPLSELQDRLDEVPVDQVVVVVCAHGIRSVIAARILAEAGYDGIYNLVDGISEWQRRGLEVEI
jgi:rhodanese-related sulfurtransferase